MSTTRTVKVERVWLGTFSEGPWPVSVEVPLPVSAKIVEIGMGWRPVEGAGAEPYPCLRYEIDPGLEAAPVYRTLYALQDGGTRDIPSEAVHLGVIQWDGVPAGVHVFGVRGPIEEAVAPAE